MEGALLIVAFYFGVRGTAAEGARGRVKDPLYLPRGAVRTVLLLGFLGVAAYTWYVGRAIPDTLFLILQILASYVAGYLLSRLLARRLRAGAPVSRVFTWTRNLTSLTVLGVALFVCLAFVYDRPDLVPGVARNVLAWMTAFYFGSRLTV